MDAQMYLDDDLLVGTISDLKEEIAYLETLEPHDIRDRIKMRLELFLGECETELSYNDEIPF